MNQSPKGIVISQLALVTVLVKAGVITVEDVIEELDAYISIFTKDIPAPEVKEPIELLKKMVLKVFEKPEQSFGNKLTWVADFVGEA